jgi:hypothetical protein
MIGRTLFVLMLLVAPLNCLAEETVDLTFDWPDGHVFEVDRRFTRLTTVAGHNARQYSACQYRWTVSEVEDGYAIRFSQFQETVPEPHPGLDDAMVLLEYVSRKTEPFLPTIVVDANAQPVRLADYEAVKAAVTREFGAINAIEDPQVNSLKGILLDDQYIQTRVLEDWNRMVQIWSGVEDAVIGEHVSGTGQTGHAAGTPMDNTWTYSVEESEIEGMLTLRVVQKPSEKEVKALLDTMTGGDIYAFLRVPRGSQLIFKNEYVTVADPATLLPVSYIKQKEWGAYAGDDKLFVGRRDIWEYTFRAPDQAEPVAPEVRDNAHGEATKTVQTDVLKLLQATDDADVDTVLRYTHPKVIEMLGGEQKTRSLLQTSLKQMRRNGVERESLEFPAAPTFLATTVNHYAIVPTLSILKRGGQRVESLNYQFGIKSVGAEHWTYMEGSRINKQNVKLFFPDFPGDYEFPEFYRKKLP